MNQDVKIKEKKYPICINSPIEMLEPNQVINIYEGDFKLRHEEFEIDVKGVIEFKWFPSIKVDFSVKTNEINKEIYEYFEKNDFYEVVVNNLRFGDCFITSNSSSTEWDYIELKGTVNDAVLGDKSIPVEYIGFSVLNLREFYGTTVNYPIGRGSFSSRICFENDDFEIIIDKQLDHKVRYENIKANGGFLILYAGELRKKKGDITLKKGQEILIAFSIFLSFLNGRRLSSLFHTGIFENEFQWCDYNHYIVDPYKDIPNWTFISIKFNNDLFKNFFKLWSDENDRDFIRLAIHWYIEANSNTAHIEGSIIMAQTAIELIYNWLLIENKGLLLGKDANNISASNKLRLLLSHLQIDYNAPDKFTHLKGHIQNTKDIEDAPDAIVQIRNAIVHSELEKRKKVSKLDVDVVWEALELSIWYIEMSLLYILEYKGKHKNRCNHYKIEFVPWVKEVKN
ncbi:MAG: HEPN domain-containing protein [Candidatus Delongbacteria bacterium]|nr:HEPN domain-containing protein [Candidatus Delongbacteria bacterium]